jgi:two-component system, cell cycle response regulator DivK
VDDNERNRRLAREVLRADGLRTIEAATGRAGIALAAEQTPNVILLDLELPDMHGTDVAVQLGKEAGTERIPVVALSARPYLGDREELLAAGFVGYLEKPIDVNEFPGQVRSYCRPASA